MAHLKLLELFSKQNNVEEISNKLPKLFQMAAIESSRAGKIGMEVGSLREKIIIAMLIYKFGKDSVDTNLPITEPEADVLFYGEKISIKTISNGLNGIKAIWTVDADSARKFIDNYEPMCDIILVQIERDAIGGLYYIPLSVQSEIFQKLGFDGYLKAPKAGTNPRGVEFQKKAVEEMVEHKNSYHMPIKWTTGKKINFDVYKRWVDLWGEEI